MIWLVSTIPIRGIIASSTRESRSTAPSHKQSSRDNKRFDVFESDYAAPTKAKEKAADRSRKKKGSIQP
jgi:hypothetical protein